MNNTAREIFHFKTGHLSGRGLMTPAGIAAISNHEPDAMKTPSIYILSCIIAIGNAYAAPTEHDVSNCLEKTTITLDPRQPSIFIIAAEIERQLNANIGTNAPIKIAIDLTVPSKTEHYRAKASTQASAIQWLKIISSVAGLNIRVDEPSRTVLLTPRSFLDLGRITIPEIMFTNAALSDVMEYMARVSVATGEQPLSLFQEVTPSNVTYVITETRMVSDLDRLTRLGPAVTLDAKTISILDLFRKIAEASGGTLDISDAKIELKVKNVKPPARHTLTEPLADPF